MWNHQNISESHFGDMKFLTKKIGVMKLSKGEDLGARKSDFLAKIIKAQWNYARCLQAVQNV